MDTRLDYLLNLPKAHFFDPANAQDKPRLAHGPRVAQIHCTWPP